MKIRIRHIAIVSTIFIFLCGCSDNNQHKLEGIWLGTYRPSRDSILNTMSVQPLIKVDKKRLRYRTVGYVSGVFERVDSLSTDYSFLNGDILSLNKIEKSISIDFHSKDSITAQYKGEPKSKMIFNH